METFESINLLETKAECDGILNFVQNEIAEVNYEKVTAEHEGRNAGNSSQSVESALTKATSELNTITGVIAGLVDGPYKEKQITEQMRLQLRVRTLTQQASEKGSLSLVKNELEVKKLTKDMDLLNDLKTQIEAKKASLPA